MGLTSWEDVPDGKIQKFDVSVAKNYLSDFELKQLEELVSAYLDIVEMQAMRNTVCMSDYREAKYSFFF